MARRRVTLIFGGSGRVANAELFAEMLRAARAGAVPRGKLFDNMSFLEKHEWQHKARQLRHVFGDARICVELPVPRPIRIGEPQHHPQSLENRRKPVHAAKIKKLLAKHPDLTNRAIANLVGPSVSPETVRKHRITTRRAS